MAAGIPPPPLNSPSGSYYWLEWYTQLTQFLNGTRIPWSNLNFTGSNIADIQARAHNSLTSIQGGNASGTASPTGNAYHMLGVGAYYAATTSATVPSGWSIVGANPYIVNMGPGITPAFNDFMAGATSNTAGVTVNNVTWAGVGTITSFTVALSGVGSFSFWCSTI